MFEVQTADQPRPFQATSPLPLPNSLSLDQNLVIIGIFLGWPYPFGMDPKLVPSHFRPPALALCPTHYPWSKTKKLQIHKNHKIQPRPFQASKLCPIHHPLIKIIPNAMDKGQNKIFKKFKRSHVNIFQSLSIPSPSSPSQNNPKYLFNEQSRI